MKIKTIDHRRDIETEVSHFFPPFQLFFVVGAAKSNVMHRAGRIDSELRVRAFNHTGPGQSASMVVPGLAQRIADAERDVGNKVSVGRVDVVRDLSDVRDIVRAYRLLVEHGTPGEAYNVCSGHGVSVREVADTMLATSDAPLELVVDPELVRPVDVPRLVGDPARLRAATGWEPEIPFDETLRDVLTAARARVTDA